MGVRETGAIFLSFLFVFIWVRELFKRFSVNKVDLLSSDSSSWARPGMTYWGGGGGRSEWGDWCVLLVKLSGSLSLGAVEKS